MFSPLLSLSTYKKYKMLPTHRPLSSPFSWLIFRTLKGNPQKELLRGLWVTMTKDREEEDQEAKDREDRHTHLLRCQRLQGLRALGF